MTVPCQWPEQDPGDERPVPEGVPGWRTSLECEHDECADIVAWYGQYRAERPQRESIRLARADLDMPHASEDELMTAVLLGLK